MSGNGQQQAEQWLEAEPTLLPPAQWIHVPGRWDLAAAVLAGVLIGWALGRWGSE